MYTLINAFARLFVGWINDYISFKHLYQLLNIINIFIASTIYFIVTIKPLYLIYNILSAIGLGGLFAIFPKFYSHKFGIK